MNAFLIDLENKPGELARIAEAIAAKGINIAGISTGTCGDQGMVAVLTNDEAGTRSALGSAGCSFREVEAVPASIADVPGALAKVARRLADAGVNIDAAIPTGMSGGKITVAFVTDNPAGARSAIGETVSTSA